MPTSLIRRSSAMDWKDFFTIKVNKVEHDQQWPYFSSRLRFSEDFDISDLLMCRFQNFQMTPSECKRLSLDHRKILHNLHYFNSKEFERIYLNFEQRLLAEKDETLHFKAYGGAIYLFIEAMKQHEKFKATRIICETTEIPLPVVRIPLENRSPLQFVYSAEGRSIFAPFPSIWAQPQIIALFDRKLAG